MIGNLKWYLIWTWTAIYITYIYKWKRTSHALFSCIQNKLISKTFRNVLNTFKMKLKAGHVTSVIKWIIFFRLVVTFTTTASANKSVRRCNVTTQSSTVGRKIQKENTHMERPASRIVQNIFSRITERASDLARQRKR